MENALYNPDDFSLYLHVVGGHSLFILLSDGHLLKSASQNEIKFYSSITYPSKFIPRYCGTIKKTSPQYNSIVIFIKQYVLFFKSFINKHQINKNDINVESDPLFTDLFNQFILLTFDNIELNTLQNNKFSQLENELLSLNKDKLKWILFWFIKWKENFLNSDYIILENLTHGMKDPAIIDIKIGSIPKKSKDRNKVKKMNDTTNEIGCRIMGLQKDNMFHHRYSTKYFGMNEFLSKITDFFTFAQVVDNALIKFVINEIQGIFNTIQEGLEYKMKFSSILLVYDIDNHSKMRINLIDFSYHEKCNSINLDSQKDFLNSMSNLLQILISIASGENNHN